MLEIRNSRSCSIYASDLLTFFPRYDWIFSGKHSIQFLANKMQDFWNFVQPNRNLIFVYLKLQVANFKNKEVTANPKPPNLEKKTYKKIRVTLNPKHENETLNTKFTLNPNLNYNLNSNKFSALNLSPNP